MVTSRCSLKSCKLGPRKSWLLLERLGKLLASGPSGLCSGESCPLTWPEVLELPLSVGLSVGGVWVWAAVSGFHMMLLRQAISVSNMPLSVIFSALFYFGRWGSCLRMFLLNLGLSSCLFLLTLPK